MRTAQFQSYTWVLISNLFNGCHVSARVSEPHFALYMSFKRIWPISYSTILTLTEAISQILWNGSFVSVFTKKNILLDNFLCRINLFHTFNLSDLHITSWRSILISSSCLSFPVIILKFRMTFSPHKWCMFCSCQALLYDNLNLG